jgi:hypothetical protein
MGQEETSMRTLREGRYSLQMRNTDGLEQTSRFHSNQRLSHPNTRPLVQIAKKAYNLQQAGNVRNLLEFYSNGFEEFERRSLYPPETVEQEQENLFLRQLISLGWVGGGRVPGALFRNSTSHFVVNVWLQL